MGHVVVHRDAVGNWQLEDLASLGVALERVETLRNTEGRDEVRLLEEIALEVRTYYRVAVADTGPATPPDGTARTVEEPAPPVLVAASEPAIAGVAEEPSAGAPPGAFPLAGPPVPSGAPSDDRDEDHEAAANGSRRGSLFSRDR